MTLTLLEVQNRLFGLFEDFDWLRHDDLGSAFTDDGAFTVSFSREDRLAGKLAVDEKGREAVGNLLRSSFANLGQVHHTLSNLIVTLQDESAEGSVHVRAHHQGAGKNAHLFEESLAVAKFRLRREAGEILIERIDYTVLIILGSMEVFEA